jgi:hypothetical protein
MAGWCLNHIEEERRIGWCGFLPVIVKIESEDLIMKYEEYFQLDRLKADPFKM